jgi:hypothetical protein
MSLTIKSKWVRDKRKFAGAFVQKCLPHKLPLKKSIESRSEQTL